MASEGGAGGATKDVEVLMAVPDVRVFRLTREAGEPCVLRARAAPWPLNQNLHN